MSAYIVSKEHIRFLVEAAISRQILGHYSSSGFSWYTGDTRNHLPMRDPARMAEVGNMLWMENIKSVSARYPNESSATLPGPRNCEGVIYPQTFTSVIFDSYDPVQVLKACDCYEYQSCEHDGWKASEAKAFIDALRSNAWHAVAGYEKAAWGAPKTIQERRNEYRAEMVE